MMRDAWIGVVVASWWKGVDTCSVLVKFGRYSRHTNTEPGAVATGSTRATRNQRNLRCNPPTRTWFSRVVRWPNCTRSLRLPVPYLCSAAAQYLQSGLLVNHLPVLIIRACGAHCRQHGTPSGLPAWGPRDACAPSLRYQWRYFRLLMFAGLAKSVSATGRLYSIDS
jgi:hypothetical protein